MNFPDMDPQPLGWTPAAPMLLVVVDTEEEFNWELPFDRAATGTHSITAQDKVHAIFDRLGVVPTYVMDYPVATSPTASRYLRSLVDAGRAEFGTHCHPWVTPPHSEVVSLRNSFHGNLPREVEAEKLRLSTEAVAQAFGRSPCVFKAGRYGLGPNTFGILKELGYKVDCSVVPHTSFAHEGGPDYHGMPDQPFYVNASRSLLEVPLTVGYSGKLHRWRDARHRLLHNHLSLRLHIPGMMSRMGWLERARLSPEGFDADTLKRLLMAMYREGARVFTLTYHSPTLIPGNTPYVRTDEELREFLRRIESVLTFFKTEMGGHFSTLERLEREAHAEGATRSSAAAPP